MRVISLAAALVAATLIATPPAFAVTYEEAIELALTSASGVLNDDERDSVLAVIAKGQAETGRVAEAAATAHQIESIVIRGQALAIVSEMHLEEDELAEALAIAEAIEEPGARDRALRDIAEWQARQGDDGGALATVERVGNPADRAIALSDLAELMAEQGAAEAADTHLSHALDEAAGIEAPALRSTTLIEIAVAQAGIAGAKGARAIFSLATAAATEIDHPMERDRILYQIGIGKSLVDRDSLAETLEKIIDPALRALVFREAGKEYSIDGRPKESRDALERGVTAAREIQEDLLRARILGKVAEFFVEQLDDLDRALEIVALGADAEGRDIILEKLIGALGESRMPVAALELADTMTGYRAKVLAMIDIAKGSADEDDVAKATEILEQAHAVAESEPVSGWQPEVREALAEAYSKIGDHDRAAGIAAAIEPLHYRAAAYSGIAEVLGNGGKKGPPHKR